RRAAASATALVSNGLFALTRLGKGDARLKVLVLGRGGGNGVETLDVETRILDGGGHLGLLLLIRLCAVQGAGDARDLGHGDRELTGFRISDAGADRARRGRGGAGHGSARLQHRIGRDGGRDGVEALDGQARVLHGAGHLGLLLLGGRSVLDGGGHALDRLHGGGELGQFSVGGIPSCGWRGGGRRFSGVLRQGGRGGQEQGGQNGGRGGGRCKTHGVSFFNPERSAQG